MLNRWFIDQLYNEIKNWTENNIVSLIAYNWNGISREFKTCAAFIIAFVPCALWF